MHARIAGALAGAALTLALAAPSAAATRSAIGLTADSHLVVVDLDQRRAGARIAIVGVGGRVIGIDVRPADGKLYAVADDQGIYTLDVASGRATRVSTLSKPFPKGVRTTVDFNPVADRLRLMGADGTNFRVNVDTGEVAVDGALKYDAAAGKGEAKPRIVAGGYTNAAPGAKTTALYTVDAAAGVVALQAPPNDGVQQIKFALGAPMGDDVAFDVMTDEKGAAWGVLVAGRALYRVDLAAGTVARVGEIEGLDGGIIDIAVLPPS
jgi:hypothetical protein